MSELFRIKRDDANLSEYMRYTSQLRNDKETSDVTLVANDGGIVQAHESVLIPNSDYIKDMLSRNPSSRVWIPEVNSEDLCKILDFIYYGKIVLNIEDMEKFIQQSKVLKVKGMSTDTYTVDIQSNEKEVDQPTKDSKIFLEEKVNSRKKEVTLGEKYFGDDTDYDIEIVSINDNLENSLLKQNMLNKANKKENLYVGKEDSGIIGYNRGDRNYHRMLNSSSSRGKPAPIIYLRGKEISKDELNMVIMKRVKKLPSGRYKCCHCEHFSNIKAHIKEHIESHFTELLYKCSLCSGMSKISSGHRKHFTNGRCVKNRNKL